MTLRRMLMTAACMMLMVACSPTLDWREFRPQEGGFSVLMPQRPGKAEKTLVTPAGEVSMRMYSVRVEETVLGAGFADFATAPDAGTQGAMHSALLKNIDGSVVSDKSVVAGGSGAANAMAGREVVKRGRIGQGADAVDGELRVRFFVKDKRYFQVVVVGRRGALPEADVDMFMASFKAD